MKPIADLGYTGFVTHEHSPTTGHDAMQELAKGDGNVRGMSLRIGSIAR